MNVFLKIGRQALVLGFDPRKTLAVLRHGRQVWSDRREFHRQLKISRFAGDFATGSQWLFFEDRFDNAGTASGHYFHQDLLVAHAIFKNQPKRHVDVGSSIYGFVSHVASFREIEVIDVRPLPDTVHGIKFRQMDITDIESVPERVCDSLSSLHAVEHFGLGRYGDPIDADGWYKGLKSFAKMLIAGGTLYFSVPTSKHQRVEFNAHRVFSVPFLEKVLTEDFEVEEISFVNDEGSVITNCSLTDKDFRDSFGCEYGCSIWTLKKKEKYQAS
ncbi:MAG: DUF268 domain-containing protein [Ilumatobacteraceae bacterium]